jgi:hypothetical protein
MDACVGEDARRVFEDVCTDEEDDVFICSRGISNKTERKKKLEVAIGFIAMS